VVYHFNKRILPSRIRILPSRIRIGKKKGSKYGQRMIKGNKPYHLPRTVNNSCTI
jgi:hypothetical protein